ncbi:phosphatase PAP2 family protein [Tenuifilum thalassicum]|uniref:Phosphatase PAP2 family protein n=1 Tax=Tenuifilum thalassicum TaxID=2590900 RepID=A0A7D3Y5X7_9BACT|nr:phosphatase PAP2 family protein [Tenuifilum thalassicum]QKG80969.1 phosphatase PAP2 family protein [Tenuifilum thalassicum]
MIEYLAKLDTELFLLLNGLHSTFWDSVMLFASGKLTWLPLYLLLIFFIARKYKWNTLWWLLAIAFVVLLADQISVHFFKNVFLRLRPCHNPDLSGLIHLVGRCGGKYGFVSSHAANTFGVAVFLSLLYKSRWASVGLIAWAAFVSYSRIYLGVHYPGDVLCGALLGSLIGSLVWKVSSSSITKQISKTKK